MITPEQYEKRKKAYLKSKMKAYNKHIAKKQEERNHDENYFLQLVKHSNRSGSHVGCLRMGINETDEHIIEKFLQWLSLRRRGHRVLTECIFENNKGRADLLDLSNCTIIEVVKSETMESIEKKKLKYPSELEVKVVRCE